MSDTHESAPTGFIAGFAGRHDAAGAALRQAFAAKGTAFAPRDMTPEPPPTPKHFEPADRETDPTEGWDPFDAGQPSTGFIDPVEAARTAGFEEGVAAAMAETRANMDRDRVMLEALVTAINDDARVDRDRLATHLRQTVLHLVTLMVGETGIDGDLLSRRVTMAAGMLADDAESALVRIHPDDVPLVEGKLPANVFAAGDATVARGSFVLESSATIVEDGPDLWLEQLALAIDRAALPG